MIESVTHCSSNTICAPSKKVVRRGIFHSYLDASLKPNCKKTIFYARSWLAPFRPLGISTSFSGKAFLWHWLNSVLESSWTRLFAWCFHQLEERKEGKILQQDMILISIRWMQTFTKTSLSIGSLQIQCFLVGSLQVEVRVLPWVLSLAAQLGRSIFCFCTK